MTFFARRFGFACDRKAKWESVVVGDVRLDKLVSALSVPVASWLMRVDGAGASEWREHESEHADRGRCTR